MFAMAKYTLKYCYSRGWYMRSELPFDHGLDGLARSSESQLSAPTFERARSQMYARARAVCYKVAG